MSAQRFLVNVKVTHEGTFWRATSAQMKLNILSNRLEHLHECVLKEFRRQYAGKTGKLCIEVAFECLDGIVEEVVEGEETGWP